ncbi:MAG TPA: BTAD domain-containing putative transcriptional regulator [Gemmatimonadales bacterium]|nr:BTAD domain-containing putative transcriptional regulator [Gemmatimonadales bacterium]
MIQLQTLGRVRLQGDRSGDTAGPAAAQPKRLALLAYLAIEGARGPVRRDLLLALFWPELGTEQARRALRQALHYLRRVIGDDVLVGAGEELSVHGSQFRCDAVEVERLIGAGEPAQALSLYEGDFFTGFHVPDVSVELEEWVDRTRARLRRHAASAAWTASEAAESAGHPEEAVALARRGCALEPDQEGGWRRLMTLQGRVGDQAGALRSYDELATRLRRDFDADPSPETAALASKLRAVRVPPAAFVPAAPPETAPSAPSPAGLDAPVAPPRRQRWMVGAAAAVLVVSGGWLAARSLSLRSVDHRTEPSLLDAGSIRPRDRLLVADFTETAGDTALAAAIAEALRVDLAQSPNVRVMTPRQVRAALERMERSADIAVNDSLARELALREGVKAFVVGRVAGIGGQWGLTVELVGAESGEVLAAVRETAADSTGLIAAVDRASESLRYRLGESLHELRALPPLAQEVTASLPALRKYTGGMRYFYAGDRMHAIPLLQEAIALDSNFATAHLSLANVYDALDEPGRAEEARLRAMQHLDRLPFQDRQVLIASDAYVHGDYSRAIDAYVAYVARYPYSAPAINNLALAYRNARHYAEAESLWARSIELDSSIVQLYFGLHSAQLLAGDFARSRRTLDLIGRRSPDNVLLLTVEVQQAAAQQDWEGAERRAEAAIAANQGDSLALVDAFEQMAGIVMVQGRLDEAERYWRTQQLLAAASGSWGRRLYGAQLLGRIRLDFRHDTAGALAIVDSALARMPLERMLPADRPFGELARFYAAAGATQRARAYLAMAHTSLRSGPLLDTELAWTEGSILLAEHHAVSAEPLLRRATSDHWCTLCGLPELARALDASGDAAGAIATWERYLETPWLFRYEVDAYELGPALLRLVELYEAKGDRIKAQNTRTRLLALWHRADATLQPALADVRTRVRAPE